MRWALPIVLVILLALTAAFAFGLSRDPRALPSPLVGRPAPNFRLTLFNGGALDTAGLRGRLLVVNFWASWCIPCRDEAPLFEALWRGFRDQGVVVIGVNIQDSPSAARGFIRVFEQTFPNGPDSDGRLSIDFGVYGVPETFIIDQNGIIVAKRVGLATEEWLVGQIQRLLSRTGNQPTPGPRR